MERLSAAEDGGEGLIRDTNDVVERLLGRERHAGGLRMEAHHPGARVLGTVPALHVTGPDPAGSPQLRDLLEEIVMDVPEEGETRGEVVDVEAPGDPPLHIGEAVRERERELLCRRRTRFADVITGNGDRIPL